MSRFTTRKTCTRALVSADVVPESALLESDLTRYDCLFLTNVGQFTASEASVLASFLKHGGGIVCFLGDQVQPDSYNRRLTGQSRRPAPARRRGGERAA